MNAAKKRKIDSGNSHNAGKRLKLTTASGGTRAVEVNDDMTDDPETSTVHPSIHAPSIQDKDKEKPSMEKNENDLEQPKRPRINKLAPPRPFPTVPTSVSATGPRSAHKEGKNFICVTRKTPLGSYMRRCKDLILKDGYKTLHLSAMGAAIPHLLHLALALPPILPFSAQEVQIITTTGTVEVQDEIIPDDEDEDIVYQTRGQSTLKVVIKIGDGEFEGDRSGPFKKNGRNKTGSNNARSGQKGATTTGNDDKGKTIDYGSGDIILEEPDQEDMEML